MIIISVGFDGVPIGVGWAAEPKKGCRGAAVPTGVAFSRFGLWERGMKWDEYGGWSGDGVGNALGKRRWIRPDHREHVAKVELLTSTTANFYPAAFASQRRAPHSFHK